MKNKLYYAETILSAAIFVNGVIHSIPKPGRHHHIIDKMAVNGMRPDQMINQGFLTSTGRFVDRCEGMRVAKDSGVFLASFGKNAPDREDLFSEDLW